jgi:3'(2'), 5'-bisphosphate nucleotidase
MSHEPDGSQLKELSESDIELLKKLVDLAGEAVLSVRQKNQSIFKKSDGSPVTEADLLANKIITEGLSKAFPGSSVLSEEESVQSAKSSWFVDPIDGTKEFASGGDDFTINVGLVSSGMPVYGVVGVPAIGTMYGGGPNLGAWKTQDGTYQTIISRKSDGERVRCAVSRSHTNAETSDWLSQFSNHELIKKGSSLKICLVASGEADIYPRIGRTMEWDTAASHAVLLGAGGDIVDIDTGEPLTYGKEGLHNPSFVASCPELLKDLFRDSQ